MGELWQQTSEMLLRQPLLWVPVLVADLFGFLVTLGYQALVQADFQRHLQYHSALGGRAVLLHSSGSAAAIEHATLVALTLGWASSFLRLLLYTVALVVTAQMVSRAMPEGRRRTAEAPALPRVTAGGVLGIVFQAWVVYVVLSFGFGWLTRVLILHHHGGWLTGGWLELGAGVVLMALLAFLLAPAALQMLTQRRTAHVWNSRSQLFAFALGVVALVLERYVTVSLRSVRITEAAARYPLELAGSWIAALPYAVMFTGLGLLALRSLAEHQDQTSPM